MAGCCGRIEGMRVFARAALAGCGPGEEALAGCVLELAEYVEILAKQQRETLGALELLPGIRRLDRQTDKIRAAKSELQEMIDSREALSGALRAASEN